MYTATRWPVHVNTSDTPSGPLLARRYARARARTTKKAQRYGAHGHSYPTVVSGLSAFVSEPRFLSAGRQRLPAFASVCQLAVSGLLAFASWPSARGVR